MKKKCKMTKNEFQQAYIILQLWLKVCHGNSLSIAPQRQQLIASFGGCEWLHINALAQVW
jgi:hypothetical protein